MEGGNGCRREEEEVAGCEQSECLERRVIFWGAGGQSGVSHYSREDISDRRDRCGPVEPSGRLNKLHIRTKTMHTAFLARKLETVFKKPQ